MSDPGTEILINAAGSAICEILKSVVQGVGKATEWLRATTTEHDPFRIVARRYAERMQDRYGSIRIFGMPRPIPLRDVYVRVNLLPKITSRRRTTVDDLERSFDRYNRHFGFDAVSVDGLGLLAEPSMKKVFVLGKPGVGKTTFLKWLALQALSLKLPDRRIPLFVSLKDWADSTLDLFTFAVAEFDSCGFPEAELFVRRLLESGGFLILFDGLDEITGDTNAAIASLRRFTEKYPDNRFVISCRLAAYSYVFENFIDVEVADFVPQQIELFIAQWFASSPSKARLFREKLIASHNRTIRELAATPLLLTMLCLAFDELMDFPRNRSDLYGEAIDALLKKWDASRSIRRDDVYKHLSPRHKQDLLGILASKTFPVGKYFMPQRELELIIADYIVNLPRADVQAIEIDSEAVLKSIEAQHGLLVERAQRIYSFSHLTFQEFFTARFLATAAQEQIERVVEAQFPKQHWREVFLLLAEMLPSADDLLLTMRRRLTKVAAEANLEPLLREIETSGLLLPQDRIPRHIHRIAALAMMDNFSWHGLHDVAQEPAIDLLNSLGYMMLSVLGYGPAGSKDNSTMGRPFRTASTESPPANRELTAFSVDDIVDQAAARQAAFNFGLETDANLVDLYIRGTHLLVDCLKSEAYVTASTRGALLDGLFFET